MARSSVGTNPVLTTSLIHAPENGAANSQPEKCAALIDEWESLIWDPNSPHLLHPLRLWLAPRPLLEHCLQGLDLLLRASVR